MDTRRNRRRALLKYKGDRCIRCKRTVDEITAVFGPNLAALFEFNHIDPKKKSKKYKLLIKRKLSGEVLDEIDLCGLMCSECHKILTLQRITGTVEVTYKSAGKEYSQEGAIQGVMKLDPATGLIDSLSFYGNVKLIPETYEIRFGDVPTGIHSHQNLTNGELAKLFLATRTEGELKIYSVGDGTFLLGARKVDEDRFEIESIARCTLLDKVSLTSYEGETFHCRNGKMISTSGRVSTTFAYKMRLLYDQVALKVVPLTRDT